MKKIQWTFIAFLVTLTGLWLLADTFLPQPLTYFSFRHVFVQYSGILGMGMMSLGMFLAIRPAWVEKPLGGLDKMYRLHKWLGIGGLILVVAHWWWALGSKWMVGWGWLERPERRPPREADPAPLVEWLNSQRGLAESLGEVAFYTLAVLLLLALIQLFPYRLFRKTHKLLAGLYLVFVYHSLILTQTDYWLQPIGWVLAALLLVGSFSALWVLFGRVGRKRQFKGEIIGLRLFQETAVLEATIRIQDQWPGHQAGQFAFVTSNTNEGAHPYTLASAWNPGEPELTFRVKERGDWTRQLPAWLHEGMPVTVEGPYGCFDFEDRASRQIWIAAGIGITPFLARLQQLAKQPNRQQAVDLFYVTRDEDPESLRELVTKAEAAGVQLHLTRTSQEDRLTPEKIRQAQPEWKAASIWYCGPAEFSKQLRRDFIHQGLAGDAYHQEIFTLR
ncbi:ferredoxin reductase family protein [Marinospirillum perlucidum]|uniref:ferredoxin reductase family protein n=1 Tax=Marinospirillum perlucidum TaxID=1982602 RepID=UPI000DF3FCBE|nr:ferric reductase-like transmembrane domain-containing protein [Marinospirillum perlucidum]